MLDLDITATFFRILAAMLEKARNPQAILLAPRGDFRQQGVNRHVLGRMDCSEDRGGFHSPPSSPDRRSMPVISASAARIAIYCDTAFDQVEASSQPAILSAT